jgi:4-amino-4-deoxy-L-arabinose transferase-like glycosyltransferase
VEKIKINLRKTLKRPEFIALFLILLLGTILRLYKIDGFMTFLGDEGRDMIIVRRLLVDGNFFLIGPGTSVGNMYLGPLYYYLIAPALLLANFSPVGPSVFVALVGVATIYLTWHACRKWFGSTAALIAAALYAISPIVIINSRSSWNPNIMPFFALLTVYSLWSIWHEKKYGWFYVLGVSFAFVLQSHYLGILFLPVILIIWVVSLRNLKDKKQFLTKSFYGLLIFAALMSPLLIFDILHNWMNVRALFALLGGEGSGSTFLGPISALANFPKTVFLIFSNLIGATNNLISQIFVIFAFLIGLLAFLRRKSSNFFGKPMILLLLWLTVGIAGIAFFNHEIYSHYFGFLFPAPFILFAALSQFTIDNLKMTGKLLIGVLAVEILIVSFINSPARGVPGYQMQRARLVAQKIKEEALGERFNLAVIAERNYEDGYKYFLEVWGQPVTHLDPQRFKESVTSQLFVVCEKPQKECDPTHSPKAEVANFGWSKIAQEWEVEGVVLYRLIHSK